MASGSQSESSGSGQTGQISSLSFIPSLLANAFFGTGIGLAEGGFTSTGLSDFRPGGSGMGFSSVVDPFGLGQVVGSNPLLSRSNPFSSFGGGGGTFGVPGRDPSSGPVPGTDRFGDNAVGSIANAGSSFFGSNLFSSSTSPEDVALNRTKDNLRFSTQSLGLGQGGFLNPGDLVSNLTDLANPASNPGIAGALQSLFGGQLGGQAGNQLLLGNIAPTFAEGLETGFKPDLQPIIDEASRAFFSDIVPQLGQNNVGLQQGVGPFSSDLNAGLLSAGGALASQLGSLEVENQNRAGDRRGELLGLSSLITDQLFNSSINAGRNQLDLGEQFAQQGTVGGRQATLLSFLNQLMSGSPVQASSSSNQAKATSGGLG